MAGIFRKLPWNYAHRLAFISSGFPLDIKRFLHFFHGNQDKTNTEANRIMQKNNLYNINNIRSFINIINIINTIILKITLFMSVPISDQKCI